MPKHIVSGLKYLAAVKLKDQGKSQQTIADILEIDRSTVSHYFNGRNLSWNSIDVAKTIVDLPPNCFLNLIKVLFENQDLARKIVLICKETEYKARVKNSCIGCGLCVDLCFMKAIKLEALKAQINSIYCCGCLLCKKECPTKSIKILEIKNDQ